GVHLNSNQNKRIEVEYLISCNLTETYGLGNEPSAEDLDTLLEGISYFEGALGAGELSFNLHDRQKELNAKVDLISKDDLKNLVNNGRFNRGKEGWIDDNSGAILSTRINNLVVKGDGSNSLIRARQRV